MQGRVFADRKPFKGLEAYCADAQMYVDGPFDSEEEDSKTGDETKRKHKGKSKSTRKPECLK